MEFSLSASVMNVVSTRVYCKVHRALHRRTAVQVMQIFMAFDVASAGSYVATWPCAKTSLEMDGALHPISFFENPLLRGQTCFEFTRSWFFRCSQTQASFDKLPKITVFYLLR